MFIALLIIIPSAVFIFNRVGPALHEAALHCISERIDKVIEETVDLAKADNGSYEDLSERISRYLYDKFSEPESIEIGTPAGNITGLGLFYASGPVIKAHMIMISEAEVKCVYDEYGDEEAGTGDGATIEISVKVNFKGFMVNGSTRFNYLVRYFIGSTGELLTSTSK